ncbi:MAG: alpha/beta hydrolase [bacterium]|nr:alpha/beta hydrolase [bacterium]
MNLWDKDPPHYNPEISKEIPRLTPYLLQGVEPRGCVIVFPGGGYVGRAPHESEPIARWLNSLGLASFVLDYRVMPNRHPVPLQDAQRAIRLVRHRAHEFGVDPGHIGILGFSAGGHLAATAGTLFDAGDPAAPDPIDRVSSRPDAMVLCYAVISFLKYSHIGSLKNLLGDHPTQELLTRLSAERQVTADTPPAFIWHTADDPVVPVANSLMMAQAMSDASRSFELHVFPHGRHGMGLAADDPSVSAWTALCGEWLRGLGFRK